MTPVRCSIGNVRAPCLPFAQGETLTLHAQVNAGQQYQVEYACSCCGLFGGSGDCCQPLDSCSYLTPSCGSDKPVAQAYYVSPSSQPRRNATEETYIHTDTEPLYTSQAVFLSHPLPNIVRPDIHPRHSLPHAGIAKV